MFSFKTLVATIAISFALLGTATAAHASPSVVRSIDGLHSTSGVAFSSDGSLAYVIQNDAGTLGDFASLVVVDTATLSVVQGPISTGIVGAGVNHAIVMSPDGSKAYVSVGDGKILPFSPVNRTFGSPITVGTAGVGQIAFTPDGSKAYVAVTDNGSGSNVKVIDVASDSVVATIATCGGPDGLVISPDGLKAFVNCSDGNLAVINTALNIVSNVFTPTGHLQGTTIVMSPDGARVYVTAFAVPSTVTTVINTTTLATEHVFTNEPKDLAFSRDGGLAYIFSASSGDLIPTDSRSFVARTAIDVTPPRPGDWFLVNRNPVSEQYWITGGSFLYVVGEPTKLPNTGFGRGQIPSELLIAMSLLMAGVGVFFVSRRRRSRV